MSDHETWRCPGCWERWPIVQDCLNCEGKSFVPGLFRHPPVDPVTCEVSADDDAILLGELRHCDTPPVWNRPDCFAVMDDHGWINDGSPHGTTVCPPYEAPGPDGIACGYGCDAWSITSACQQHADAR